MVDESRSPQLPPPDVPGAAGASHGEPLLRLSRGHPLDQHTASFSRLARMRGADAGRTPPPRPGTGRSGLATDDAADEPLAWLARSSGTDPAALRREVSAFRLALTADLAVAAAAVDEGAAHIAGDVLAADRREAADFADRMLGHVAVPAAPSDVDEPAAFADRVEPAGVPRAASHRSSRGRPSPRRRVAAVATAVALAGTAGGVALAAQHGSSSAPPVAATTQTTQQPATTAPVPATPSSLVLDSQRRAAQERGQALQVAARGGTSAAVTAATAAFTASVAPLLARAPADAAVARELAQLLLAERAALAAGNTADPVIAAAVAATDSMLRRLQASVPASVLGIPAPTRPPVTVPTRRSAVPPRRTVRPPRRTTVRPVPTSPRPRTSTSAPSAPPTQHPTQPPPTQPPPIQPPPTAPPTLLATPVLPPPSPTGTATGALRLRP